MASQIEPTWMTWPTLGGRFPAARSVTDGSLIGDREVAIVTHGEEGEMPHRPDRQHLYRWGRAVLMLCQIVTASMGIFCFAEEGAVTFQVTTRQDWPNVARSQVSSSSMREPAMAS
jgi:hypothetical protein